MKKCIVLLFMLFTVTAFTQIKYDILSSRTSIKQGSFLNYRSETGYIVFYDYAIELFFRDTYKRFTLIKNTGDTENYKGTYSGAVYMSNIGSYTNVVIHIANPSGNIYVYLSDNDNFIVELKLK